MRWALQSSRDHGRTHRRIETTHGQLQRCREVEQHLQHHCVLVHMVVGVEMLWQASEGLYKGVELGPELRLHGSPPKLRW
jgi:hypothetical protein